MSVPKMEFVDTDSVDDQLDAGNAEYMLSGSEDNIVAYRILQLSDESPKNNQTIHMTTSVPTQYIQLHVIDNSNGFIQAVPTTQINTVSSTPIKVESQSTNSSSNSNSLKMRTSVAIAPKIDFLPLTSYSSSTTSNSTVSTKLTNAIDPLSSFKKRDDRRRATHNEVERRRRDKINHWIMKLGAIIPANGSTSEIANSGGLSIAAIEGQSKGGILSKACEYVQMLQEKHRTRNETDNTQEKNTSVFERKKYEDEIARLRGENELLKAILIKNGINYVKERTSIKSNEYS